MSYILSHKKVITRKPHVCFGCARRFPSGSEMAREGIVDDGAVFTCYLCKTCQEVLESRLDMTEFGEGDLLEDALELEREKELDTYDPRVAEN